MITKAIFLRLAAGAALLACSGHSSATSVVNVSSIVCEGGQTISDSNFLSMVCTGDLSIGGGSITSDVGILISSTGALNLNNLSIVAPSVEFNAGTTMNIGSGISITANSLSLSTSGSNGTAASLVAPGASISLGGAPFQQITIGNSPLLAVPEPSEYLTMIAGLLLLVTVNRYRRVAPSVQCHGQDLV